MIATFGCLKSSDRLKQESPHFSGVRFNDYMVVKVKRKELEKLGINLPQMKKLFTHYYISMLLVSDDLEVTSVRLSGKHFVEKYVLKVKKSSKLYEKLKEFYLNKL